eukprot:m51a1_g433 putative family 3 adenylate cyclase (1148) ;mRNA; r:51387-59375
MPSTVSDSSSFTGSSESVAWSDAYTTSSIKVGYGVFQRVAFGVNQASGARVLAFVSLIVLALQFLTIPLEHTSALSPELHPSSRWISVIRSPVASGEVQDGLLWTASAVLGLGLAVLATEYLRTYRGSTAHQRSLWLLKMLFTALPAFVFPVASLGLQAVTTPRVNIVLTVAQLVQTAAHVFVMPARPWAYAVVCVVLLGALTGLHWYTLVAWKKKANCLAGAWLTAMTASCLSQLVGALVAPSVIPFVVCCALVLPAGAAGFALFLLRARHWERHARQADDVGDIKFGRPAEARLMVRRLYNIDPSGSSSYLPRALGILSRAKELFPRESALHYEHAMLLYHVDHDALGALVHLKTAKRLPAPFDVRFLTSSLLQTVQNATHDAERKEEVQVRLGLAAKHHKMCRAFNARFWQQLVRSHSDSIDTQQLLELVRKGAHHQSVSAGILQDLLRENPNNVAVFKMLLFLPVNVLDSVQSIHDFLEMGKSASEIEELSEKEQERVTKSIVDACEDIVILCSQDRAIEVFNPVAESVTGYTAAEAIRRNVSIVIPTDVEANQKLLNDIFRDITALKEREAQIIHERNRAEGLLLNIFPKQVAEKLNEAAAGNSLDEASVFFASHFEEATVLFADICGFTTMSSSMTAQKIVEMLNGVFSLWDNALENYGVEKIKTIGDAYMVVSGVPEHCDDHADRMLRFAVAMLGSLYDFTQETSISLSVRIGINAGPVVAGIIGTRKIAYDLWGDTVNVASRMEHSGLPGTIQVTEAMYRRHYLKHEQFFVCRGALAIQGKGDIVCYNCKPPAEALAQWETCTDSSIEGAPFNFQCASALCIPDDAADSLPLLPPAASPAPPTASTTRRAAPLSTVWRVAAVAFFAGAALTLLALSLVPGSPLAKAEQRLLRWRIPRGAACGVLFVCAAFSLALGLPVTPLDLAAGFILGPWAGALTAVAGNTLGALMAFVLARTVLKSWTEERAKEHPRFEAISEAVGEKGFVLVVLLRLSPVIPLGLCCYLLGVTQISFAVYAVASAVGLAPFTCAYAYLGTLLSDLSAIWTKHHHDHSDDSQSEYNPLKSKTATIVWLSVASVTTVTVIIVTTCITRRALARAIAKNQARASQATTPVSISIGSINEDSPSDWSQARGSSGGAAIL